MKDEALKLALEALTIQLENSNGEQKYADAIAEIKALAQPPAVQAERQPLTDEEIEDCLDAADQMYCERDGDKELFKVRAVLAAHNIGASHD